MFWAKIRKQTKTFQMKIVTLQPLKIARVNVMMMFVFSDWTDEEPSGTDVDSSEDDEEDEANESFI